MYLAALRPAEAVALRRQDCHLPEHGWGRLTLEKSRPEVNRRWADTATAHEERGLNTGQPPRPAMSRSRPSWSPSCGSTSPSSARRTTAGYSAATGQVVASTAISDVWAEARTSALAPEQVASPLAGRPYDLRHAAVSLWLNAGVSPQDVAQRAGHSVEVLLRVYAKCLDGGETVANKRIDAALRNEP
jgi:integrase